MPYKARISAILLLVLSFAVIFSAHAAAQDSSAPAQVNLSNIGSATVTLFYYDKANSTVGAIVPMPDNPQLVNNVSSLAAPGMYTFSQVRAGNWYYLEADNGGNKWYTIFYMPENAGTVTANVAIPPLEPLNATAPVISTASSSPMALPSPTTQPTVSPTITVAPTASPTASPGMTLLAALLAGFAGIIIARRRR
jgi:hypothetical protein